MTDLKDDPNYGKPRHPSTGVRARIRRTPAGAFVLKTVVFLIGLAFVALGAALVVLPGPLTIPPVLLGVWIWSTEFAFADKLLDRARKAFDDAWAEAKKRPVISGIFTAAGLIGAAVLIWANFRYDLLDRGKDAIGL